MKVVITGAGGQVGRAVLGAIPADTRVVGLTRTDLDVCDAQSVMQRIRAEKPDLIVNAAAYTAVDKAEQEPLAAERGNSLAPLNLALAAQAVGARLLHISTDYVFDGCASRPYAPDDAANPQCVYGLTKLAGEQHIMRALPGRSVILRTAWVYSAHGNNFVRTMLRLMSSHGSVRVVADQVGSPTAAHSVAGAIWAVAAHPDIQGIYHWTDAGVASWYDFAVAIAEEAASNGVLPASVHVQPIATEDYPTAAKRPAYSVLDVRSLLKVVQIPRAHWRQQLRIVLREMTNA